MLAFPSNRHATLHIPHFALLLFLATAYCLSPTPSLSQDDPFASGVRTTPWLSPADEQKAFNLPPGFEINLVAAEPDIQKPLNMAFDERGRIWLTNTIEYPYAAPPDRPGKDTIKILEDTDGNGRYEKVTTFADGLNIPMGILPWKGGCVAFSIPNLWHFEDTDGDGVCDKRTVLYGPFDTSRDTHGMINALRRGWDGWVYACHGFNNDSRVKGTDGHEIHMQSGNVFRFQLDGSRIEHFTHGQVNPFGMCFHGLFDIFTADCHSKPIYQLIRGGYYPSFGKPNDGLGFVPPMMDHLHGSTAICGLVFSRSCNFPREFQDNFFSGNVMTSRINRNKVEMLGSTFKAVEQPDFLTTSDPWFRPVDIQIGPDGAMYIADFYNRIIGHYEVPLPHPGRDRTSGRIWRITYTKPDDQEVFAIKKPADLTKASVKELIEWIPMDDDMRPACLELCSRGKECVPELKERWKVPYNSQLDNLVLLWSLEANGALDDGIIQQALDHESRWEGTHLMRIMSERKDWNDFQRAVVLSSLGDRDPFVARAAADAMGRHCTITQIWPLLARLKTTPEFDTHLRQSIRMAIRDHVLALPSAVEIGNLSLSEPDQRELASICLGAPNSTSAAILLRYLETHDDNQTAYLQHVARYADVASLPDIVRIGKSKATNLELQAEIIQSLATGLTQRKGADTRPLAGWAEEVANKLLANSSSDRIPWTAVPIDGLPSSESPWVVTPRASRDGDKDSLFFSSLPRGEQRTGTYRSGVFDLPAELSFWCAGHSGRPPAPLNDCNYIRLRDAATHELLAESRPPRNDTARMMTWKITNREGEAPAEPSRAGKPRRGYIELIDADTANAYAWFAVGRFSLPALNPSDAPQKQQLAAEIIGKLKLDSLKPQMVSLVAAPSTDSTARTAIAQALLAFAPDARASTLTAALADAQLPDDLRPRIGQAISTRDNATLLDCLRDVLKRSPLRLQTTLAQTLAGDAPGADALLTLIESGQAAPRLLLLPAVNNKLTALKNADLDARTASITSKLPPADAILDALITDRRRAFAQAKTNLTRGQAIFEKHCIACHKIADKGNLIGPQLDGIGNRGVDRLLEDVLDPNRNVDVAFRTTTLRLADGRVLSGLQRREEGNQLILADNQGKEFSIAKNEIDEQQKTPLSLMPANVAEIVPADEFADLIGYLLSQRLAQK